MSLQTVELPSVGISIKNEGIAILELNRPRKRNALSQALIDELVTALRQFDHDPIVFAVILTSSGPFSAGADLNELATLTTAEATRLGWLKDLNDAFSSFRKPVLAAVRGFALGGGFELALMCDMIFASADAQFGFPEITLGTIPGAGGTQRLTKTVGKQKAMELILTGATTSAAEMERLGVVNRVVSSEEDVLEVATRTARTIASFSAPAIGLAKQAILAAETTTLGAGLEIELKDNNTMY
ncbi:Enoyl-CoA hydratase/isomerase [Pyrenophora tritici-repentis]|uniref:Enoyl-CoA hydratase/isomerase n=1 Tax=Pyrenophora tritici-repentis TaxID=45151 RepID=A0A317AKX9_9PLEO|nr:Enoyl-CoA hydratase/isomerase [Pyrenophora tritici-repentis]KAI1686747.1 Enoyl-CoA hydratase/isomerase [Pyrenophora tritici-repentis]